LLASVEQADPGAKVIVVDNAADVPYPNAKRLDKRVCMSAAMNYGAKFARKADWLVFMNNDVICTGLFQYQLASLPQDTIYGVDMLDWWGRRWLDGWIMAIPRPVWEAVGLFDENFVYAGFEDADYCFRALEMGYKVEAHPLPFVHKELHSRFTMPGYMAQRERNIEYLCEKWDIHR
jgi:GT2 family glycosyltransferase